MTLTNKDRANAIRVLSMDAVQAAESGHPGAPMGMADIAEVLWCQFLKHNPQNPNWPDRDRFVLSNGHGSMLIYSLLHLTGYDLSIEDLKSFRQLHSKTAGHPEYGETPGVETTTGPLGQGLSNGVGMAIAEKILAAQFNKENLDIVDHFTYVFAGDGCLMEGISHEVCSLAGTLGLGKLIVFYDDNGISIDGQVEGWFTDNTPARFKSYGWQVLDNVDGHSSSAIMQAVESARSDLSRPTLICCKTVIGFGSPNKAGTSKVHGAALGQEEITAVREHLNWPYQPFEIPAEIYQSWDAKDVGAQAEERWNKLMAEYRGQYPDLAKEFDRRLEGQVPEDFAQLADRFIKLCQVDGQTIASRKASQNCLDAYGPLLPELLGGSADLAGSNNTLWDGCNALAGDRSNANYIHYGVREFGMTGIMNGLSLHGGFIPYGGTFLVFMEYARNAVRMASLMKQRSIYVYTHDSIGLGEDGPTHQPVEQLTALRSTPNLSTWRPCDTVECAVAWKSALMQSDGPTALILSRQALAHQQRDPAQLANISRGGYVLADCKGIPDAILIATGSEIGLVMDAAEQLNANSINVRVVSMPCCEIYEQQDDQYKESVLPKAVRNRIAVEASHVDFWSKYVGLDGYVVGMRSFGASGPAEQLYEHFGITVNTIMDKVLSLVDADKLGSKFDAA